MTTLMESRLPESIPACCRPRGCSERRTRRKESPFPPHHRDRARRWSPALHPTSDARPHVASPAKDPASSAPALAGRTRRVHDESRAHRAQQRHHRRRLRRRPRTVRNTFRRAPEHGGDPDQLAARIVKIAETRSPLSWYGAGREEHWIPPLTTLLPQRLVDRLLRHSFHCQPGEPRTDRAPDNGPTVRVGLDDLVVRHAARDVFMGRHVSAAPQEAS